jgi:transcription elongation factor Elf1
VSVYRFDVTCPSCGRAVEHNANGTTDGHSTRAVVSCRPCRNRYLIEVTIRSEAAAVQADRLGVDYFPKLVREAG